MYKNVYIKYLTFLLYCLKNPVCVVYLDISSDESHFKYSVATHGQ